MTTCGICAVPCPGTDDDGGPLCFACFEANFAGVEVRPRPPRLRELLRPGACVGAGGHAPDGRAIAAGSVMHSHPTNEAGLG